MNIKWNILDRPESGTAKEWKDWENNTKANHPVLFYLFDTVPSFFGHLVYHAKRWTWDKIHRFVPKYQYNVIRIKSLPPGYYDPDTRILHGVMDEVAEYYELTIDTVLWSDNDDLQAAHDEIKILHDWWVNDYPNKDTHTIDGDLLPVFEDFPEEWGILAAFDEDYENTPEMARWKIQADLTYAEEQKWMKLENDMLIRAINIRHYLWYP